MIISVAGPIIDSIVGSVKNAQNLDINGQRNLIDVALQKVYNKSANKAEKLANKLAALPYIQRTPALSKAVDNMSNRIRKQQSDLKNDEVEAMKIALDTNMKLDNAADSTIFTRSDKINKLKGEIENASSKIEEIEQKIK